ncbi:uroporphyrinogen-III synthase [Paenimyroides tangerinum]|uniref:Uroporphyrinogen-III synthase n=1 Tax=Paenimyroides tangerinum TaxID=2488728 RepID=A0A3P3WB20_9FLAO|nr:uroporphyrinogen-III synthase [Paenimyroides tangerinum]RRJ92381.1 uroporphyrinogen-III synthase [Paenimyroides tangerinum]
MKNISILSTKKLKSNQKELLLNADFSVDEADFIKIKSISFQIKNKPDLLLFTSQNGVKSVLESETLNELKQTPAICVGSKTKKLLEDNGFTVLESEEYASDLAPIIQNKFNKNHIAFFAGNLRRNVLPIAMQKANIIYDEYLVYENTPNHEKINSVVNAILFFSPSGVYSYLNQNKIENQICFCIGTTTAEALSGITTNIVIANQQTVENVIEQCINYYK